MSLQLNGSSTVMFFSHNNVLLRDWLHEETWCKARGYSKANSMCKCTDFLTYLVSSSTIELLDLCLFSEEEGGVVQLS
jgi:hypothetical protein